jgi:ferric-dicitrate binding protein FerR (iron transport regulator)
MRTFPENMDPDILIAFLCDETSPEESILVKEWIASSEENKARFEALNKIWNVSEMAFPQPAEVDTEKAWQKLSGRIDKYESERIQYSKSKITRSLFLRYSLRAAAVFIPMMLIVYLIFSHYSKPKMLSFATAQVISEKTLSDGSIVKLNQNSELKYPEEFDDLNREVSLTGEAFFKVSPNPKKPFIIHSGFVEVKVVGTSFNIKTYPDGEFIEVFVIEGKVLLYTVNNQLIKIDSIFLEAGNKGVFEKRSSLLKKTDQTDGSELFWINNTLIFNKTPLETVFSEIEEKYNVKITLKNKEIEGLRLTTSFAEQPIDSIMMVIAKSFDLKISRSGLTFEIDVAEN